MANYSYTIPDGEHKGETLWSGRYCTVAGVIMLETNDVTYVLATKRGKSTPNNQGKWCVPCGFLENDETGEQGILREIFEETGLKLDFLNLDLVKVITNPDEDKNVTLVYFACFPISDAPDLGALIFPNKEDIQGYNTDEVEAVAWVDVTNDLGIYDWAFNHDTIIENLM